MKTIEQLTNVDKAKIMFDLFRNEIPEFIRYLEQVVKKVIDEKEELQKNWTNHLLSFNEWLYLARELEGILKVQGKNLQKNATAFSAMLFGGFLALFTNHCLEQFGSHRAKSPRFEKAIGLLYLPVKPSIPISGQYLVLEIHGGPEYATICTDTDGNTLVFNNREDAEAEAGDCQDGLVIEI